ncbi:SRPBCC family protein [Nesterenkonia ebinurensis]|uniref:dimethyladenosine transferase n=1 Tax=Nesterenkonia ebinurensis TaxID=2608252 RepID=UPI00123D3E2D|nr:dimethyladenosine transferase [Nesterenkonia ebinurensis]
MSSAQSEPVRLEAGPHTVSYSITVPAPAAEIYALLANPHRHHEIDGSHTVQARAIGAHELTEGARFSVHMRKFGLPYRLPLRVTQARRPAAGAQGVIEWRQPTGHRWRWEFEVLSENDDALSTLVTESFDTGQQFPPARAAIKLAKVLPANAKSIQESLRRVRQKFT